MNIHTEDSLSMDTPLITKDKADQFTSDYSSIGEYLKTNAEWNAILWCAGAFHFPLFDIYDSPVASLVQLIACFGFIFQLFACLYDLYAHLMMEMNISQVAYIVGDVVVMIQNATIVMGISYAVDRIQKPFGRPGTGAFRTRSAAGESACFEYALKKTKVYVSLAVLMFTFTGCIIAYNGYTAVSYSNSFLLSLAAVVFSLVVGNLLSLWMMIFIWVDTEASNRVVSSAVVAACDCTLSVNRYYRKLNQFRSRMVSIASLLDVVVIVAYINTAAFGFILLVCPAEIALSYVATFGRETVILLLMLPGIAAVNDRHTELMRRVGESDLSQQVQPDGVRISTYLQPTPTVTNSSPELSNPNIVVTGMSNSRAAAYDSNNDLESCSGGFSAMETGAAISVSQRHLQEQINQLRLWVAVNNAPLHIPILNNKIIGRDSLLTQLFGSVLFVLSIGAKMLLE